jgi:two-component system, cell cycle sensor histidine kinase and response regulator CckA
MREGISSSEAVIRRRQIETNMLGAGNVAVGDADGAEAWYRDFFDNSVEGICQSDLQGRILDVNKAMAEICGYTSPSEFCASVLDLASDLYVEPGRSADFVRILKERGKARAFESRIRRKDGVTIWISENARAVCGVDGEPCHYESMVSDISERKATEKERRSSEERFREMAERIDDVFYIASLDTGNWSYVSPAFERIWGHPLAELYARPALWAEAIMADDQARVLAARGQLSQGKEFRIEYRVLRPDGEQRWIDERSYPIREAAGEIKRSVGVAMDITQRRQLEEQLLQAQKMEAVGQLAGGLAHDFNNVLTVVIGYARLLLDYGSLPPDAIEPVTQIYSAGTRAANLTRQLLIFSRKQPVIRRAVDLNQIAGEIVDMLRRLIGAHIKLELELAPNACTIDADSGMIEQVLMNLAVNARDAMSGGGTLVISTRATTIGETEIRNNPQERPGDFICLTVRDTGCGISAENLNRVFEPFFTTKAAGHGTGLGLAMAFGTVKQHGGWIEVESTVGVGTSFRIFLPAAPVPILVTPNRLAKVASAGRGSETVLLVEDEGAVREFAVSVLRNLGYRVLQACSGVDALEVWKWHGPRISLLFTDLVMPDGMSGVELATRLRREKPVLKIVLTSGYTNEATTGGLPTPPGTHFIHKPYKPQALAQAVRDALDGTFS